MEDNALVNFIDTYPNADSIMVNKLLQIFTLSEQDMAISQANSAIADERLWKRRKQYQFDLYLQNQVYKATSAPYITTEIIKCGNSGLYKSELIIDKSIHFHFNHSFNRNAQYNAPYLAMNTNPNEPRFAYFLYELSGDKDFISRLELIVPSAYEAKNLFSCDFERQQIRMEHRIEN